MLNNRLSDYIFKFAKGITVALLNYLLAFAILLQDYPMTSVENFYSISRIPVVISVSLGLLIYSFEGLTALAGMIFFFLFICLLAPYVGIYLAGTNLLIVFLGILALLLAEFLFLLILRIVRYSYETISNRRVR